MATELANQAHGPAAPAVQISRLRLRDLKEALLKGAADFRAMPSHLLFLAVIYPLVIAIAARVILGEGLLQLAYPILTGGALLGPFVAIGLYEISRRRELGEPVSWQHCFAVLRSPAIGSIVVLGVVLAAIFAAWLATAQTIYDRTVGGKVPEEVAAAIAYLVGTGEGWALILIGNGVGFVFAVVALAISVVSFPMLLHRNPGVAVAVGTSLRAVAANIVPMMIWGLIVGVLLMVGSVPAFVGLAIVVPVLGHATWHLYRKVVVG